MLLQIEIETFAAIGGLIIIIAFLGNIFYFVAKLIFIQLRGVNDYFVERFRDKLSSNANDYSNIYQKYKFTYYNRLPEKLQVKFLLRVKRFVQSKKFTGRKDLEVTEEMKVMIASSAVQLTFGLRNYLLDSFSDIIIYPESYYSPITGKMHMGEANPKGILVISWKDFQRGYALDSDTFNVGLHEMAHALELDKRLGGSFDEFFSAYYEKWKLISESEYEKVSEDGESFFRSYAGTNRHEFFAVCIEYFFEATEKLKNALPDMYAHLCVLLNQDPLNKDYQISYQLSNKLILQPVDFSEQPPQYATTIHKQNVLGITILAALFFLAISIYTSGKMAPVFAVFFILSWTSRSVLQKLYGLELYKDHLCIVGSNGKIKSQFPFESVVLLEINQSSSSLIVSTFHDAEISKSTFLFEPKDDDVESIKNILREKRVPVRISE